MRFKFRTVLKIPSDFLERENALNFYQIFLFFVLVLIDKIFFARRSIILLHPSSSSEVSTLSFQFETVINFTEN